MPARAKLGRSPSWTRMLDLAASVDDDELTGTSDG
jgi:hypothetical protein